MLILLFTKHNEIFQNVYYNFKLFIVYTTDLFTQFVS